MSSLNQPNQNDTILRKQNEKQFNQLDLIDQFNQQNQPTSQLNDQSTDKQNLLQNQHSINEFDHSKSLIYRKNHDIFNHQLYNHHRLHHHKLNQNCNHHYQCVLYSNLVRNQQFKKDHKKKNKKKYSKRAKRRKKTFVKEPPDGGYGWVVVFASFLISLIADGISFSFGMIYVELIKFFGQSKSKTAWVGSLFFAMPLLAGPIASALTDRYGCRLVTIASGLIAASGMFISSWVQSLEFLYLTFSLTGIGLALSYVSSIVIVAHYFEKRRSLATGLAVCGTGIGTFVFPPLTNYILSIYQWQKTLIIISCFFLIIMFCGFLIRDLNLEEETEESLKYKEKKRLKQEQKSLKKLKDKSLVKENSDLSRKLNGNDYKIDLDLKSEAVHLLNNNNLDTKNENIQTKSIIKPVNQNSLVTSSSDDSYSLSSESSSSSSSKSSSTSDLRTINDPSFSEKLSDQFDKFDSLLFNKCDDDDVFETNLLTSCNDSTTNLKNLVRSNSTICLPTYLEELYNTLKTSKELSKDYIGNQSNTTTPKLVNKNKVDPDLSSSQFHKDILLNIQKKPYFYKLIHVYPYLFPECCREQQLNCCTDELDQLDRINQTVHSEKEFFLNKAKKPCVHTLSNVCDYDMKFDSKKDNAADKEQNSQSAKNVEFKFTDQVAVYPNNNLDDKQKNEKTVTIIETVSPTTTSTLTTSTTTTTNQPTNHKIALKPLPNKSVGQSLISSFVQLDGTYFRHMKLKRDSISYRSAMLNTPRYRLKASSCPDIYRNSLLSLHRDHSRINLILTLKYFICDIFDLNLLRDYRFALFCISNSCLYACIDVPYIYLPEMAIQKGTSEKMASYLISVIGIVNTLGIVIVGYIGDKSWIKTLNLYSLFTTISGFSIFFLPVLETYEGFVVLAAIYGFSISVNYTLITVILVDILTIERFTTGYGFLLLVQGCSTLFGPPLAGWLFDISGSYNITFYITGICIIFSGIIVLPIDNRIKCNRIIRKYNSTKSNSSFKNKNGLNLDKCLNNDNEKFTNLLNA